MSDHVCECVQYKAMLYSYAVKLRSHFYLHTKKVREDTLNVEI